MKCPSSTLFHNGGVALHDSFDAARLLLVPECLPPGKELVALVPHRDMLVFVPASVGQDRDRLREEMQALKCEHHSPLLDQAVRVTRDGFELV